MAGGFLALTKLFMATLMSTSLSFFAELCRQKVISLPDIHLVSNLFL